MRINSSRPGIRRTVVLLALASLAGWGLGGGAVVAAAAQAGDGIAAYNVVWDSPSKSPDDFMPLGNGDIGVSACVEEKSGELVFYVSKTDAWDENGRLCKVGCVRLSFDPAPVLTNGFRQELKLRDGVIEFAYNETAQSQTRNADLRVRLWVDADEPVIRVEAESETPVTCRASVVLWRVSKEPFGDDDDSYSGKGLKGRVRLPDVVVTPSEPRVVWYHRNTESIYALSLTNQNLQALEGRFADPLLNHTFGASLSGEGFVRESERGLKSAAPAKRHRLSVCVLAERAATPEFWLKHLEGIEKKARSFEDSRQATAAWWNAFWRRSWVLVDGKPETAVVTRGYVLQRFMNACAGRGRSPIKFNGSIFTPVSRPDWRAWGGAYWFQNTRPTYWAMLPAGDFEMLEPWFRMYLDALPLSQARVKTYYTFENAAVFPEVMSFWGLPNNICYGWGNKGPELVNGYIKRDWNGGLELIAVMLDRYDFTQDREFARTTLVPLADPLLAFFDQYWKRDANGRIRFVPSQALETYQATINPLPDIAGLWFVLPRLLELPAALTTEEQRKRWKRMLTELPPLPIQDGRIMPAEVFGSASNSENPELYCIYPFRLFGVGRENLELARNTYKARKNPKNVCWGQDEPQAALLGLGEEAARLVAGRVSQKATSRFPAMWPAFLDYSPDQDHGNNLIIALHFMLLQYDAPSAAGAGKIYLFPAWPKSWNVAFKLHAPMNTTVEGELRDGKVVSLTVLPKSREADIVNLLNAEGLR